MRALTFKRYGKSPDIGFSEVPRPTLKADDLLVQVHAASVNPIDNTIPTGIFKPVLKFGLPATLGSDLAGARCSPSSRHGKHWSTSPRDAPKAKSWCRCDRSEPGARLATVVAPASPRPRTESLTRLH